MNLCGGKCLPVPRFHVLMYYLINTVILYRHDVKYLTHLIINIFLRDGYFLDKKLDNPYHVCYMKLTVTADAAGRHPLFLCPRVSLY